MLVKKPGAFFNAQRGWLYGMEMDLYKSQFLDGCPDKYGTILYSFLYTWGSKGVYQFFGLSDFLFWCGDITV
jgi:hypothetical protein